jgi:hypothetical protein
MPALRRAMLADQPAGPTLCDVEASLDMIDRIPAACGA